MIQRLVAIVALLAFITFGSVFLYSRLLTNRAKLIVRTTSELSDKHAPSLADIQERLGSRLELDECRGSECGYTVGLSNRVLAALHIAPYTEIQSYFWTKDGVLFRNMLDYTTRVDPHHSIVSHVQIDFCAGCQAFSIHPWDAASPPDTNGIVEIGNEASTQDRRIVLSLNTACLTAMGGCKTVADLLPTVWKRTAEKKIACVIQNDRGFVQKPVNWP